LLVNAAAQGRHKACPCGADGEAALVTVSSGRPSCPSVRLRAPRAAPRGGRP